MNRISDDTAAALEKYLITVFETKKEPIDGRSIVKLLDVHKEYNYYKHLEEEIENDPFKTRDLYEQKKITAKWKAAALICAGVAVLEAVAIWLLCLVI